MAALYRLTALHITKSLIQKKLQNWEPLFHRIQWVMAIQCSEFIS